MGKNEFTEIKKGIFILDVKKIPKIKLIEPKPIKIFEFKKYKR